MTPYFNVKNILIFKNNENFGTNLKDIKFNYFFANFNNKKTILYFIYFHIKYEKDFFRLKNIIFDFCISHYYKISIILILKTWMRYNKKN